MADLVMSGEEVRASEVTAHLPDIVGWRRTVPLSFVSA
jgi:hypothetical protein